ncbi:hypothetical protein [Haliangium sp.]|uniref:hypothetical protein n=1 Tax=Haliangium sp. TaxID=2663208 RepID=UPI003D0E1DD6
MSAFVRTPALASLFLLVTWAGCGGGSDGDVELLAGTSDANGNGFVEVDDGTPLTLIPGAQGGFHIWLNMRVRGVSGRLYVERQARRVSDDALVFRGLLQLVDVPAEADTEWWESPIAAPAFMCPSPIGIQVFDEPLRFEVHLLDSDENLLATDAVVIIPRCPEDDQAEFCQDICAG